MIKRLSLVMLEKQIKEDIDNGDEFKVHFVLFMLGALSYPIMKVYVKHFFLHILE